MNRKISEPQRRVLEILATVNGGRYYFDFLPLVKTALYPHLWGDTPTRDVKAKNTARKEIATVVEDLRERDLIQLTTRGNIMYMKIKLTPQGEGMVTTGSTDGNNR